MTGRDPRVDAYVAKAAAFAQPILTQIRAQVHAACPDVVETIKWGMPFFDHHGLLCHMAAFKGHCALGFWNHETVTGTTAPGTEAMGQFGRIETLADLPSKPQLRAWVRKAAELNAAGVKAPRYVNRQPKPPLAMPETFAAALEAHPAVRTQFEAFTPGKRREYLEWIIEAKTEATRARRIAQALEWIAEGKSRNWKHQNG